VSTTYQDRSIRLKSPSASAQSKAVDVTELPIFMGCGGGLSEADLHQDFSLDDVISSVNIPSPVRTRQTTRYHKNSAAFALRAFFTTNKMNLQVVVDSQVPGQTYLHSIETSSDKRPDVTVYDSSCQKVVLLVEVQSSPIQQSVIKEAIKYHRSARRNGQGSEDTETTVKQAGGTPISLLRRQLDPQYNSL